MKNRYMPFAWKNREVRPRLIARFGAAKLVKTRDARYELRDATQNERTAACEWISLFMHEAVIRD